MKSKKVSGADNQQERSAFGGNPQRPYARPKHIINDYVLGRYGPNFVATRRIPLNGFTLQNFLKKNLGGFNKLSVIPCQVSSDPHERLNDWGTVSTRRPVKMQYR